jgi:GntR family transcriptional regulator, trigonelline degradation regulator
LTHQITRSEPLGEQVYRRLKEEILKGVRLPNERLIETKIAVELQTSRSPVREAIRLLQAEQIAVEKNGSVHVFQPSYEDFCEIYDLRLVLEPAAARKAAVQMNPHHLQLLAENLRATKECLSSNDLPRLITLNYEFHQCIWNAARNSRFDRILQNVSILIHYYCSLVLKLNRQQTNILVEHQEIFEALQVGDSENAAQLMYHHIAKDLQVISSEYHQFQTGDFWNKN